MKNLESIILSSADVKQFAGEYIQYLARLLEKLDAEAIAAFVAELEKARVNGSSIFIIGNGGSAATASHMANDLGIGAFCEGAKPFRAIALTDCTPSMTAVSNDFGYDELFVRQLRTLYRDGDLLVAISASGNSPNIVSAVQWVRGRQGMVIGLVGFDGGKLKALSDIVIQAETPVGEYGPVEDVHMILDHLVYTWLSKKAKP